MSVPSQTHLSYDPANIREDMSDIVDKISPTETPFMTAIGRDDASQPHFEWNTIELVDANEDNAALEGDDIDNDAPNEAVRLGNYAQLMDKVKGVSSTAEASTVAGNTQKMKQQMMYAAQEIKRDAEKRFLCLKPAVAGNASTPRQTAGLGAFLRTNVSRGQGGADPTLSSTTSGYPDAGPQAGTPRAFSEELLKDAIQAAWEEGGRPNLIILNGYNKRVFSSFAGNATRFKDADRRLNAAIEIYESDFGQLKAVPNHFTEPTYVYIVDPTKAAIATLQPMKNFALAKSGHSDRRAVSVEWGLKLRAEKAHAAVADVTATAP